MLVFWQSVIPPQVEIPEISVPFLHGSLGPYTVSLDVNRYLAAELLAWAPQEAANQAQENILFSLQKNGAHTAWIIEGSINALLVAYAWCIWEIRRKIRLTAKAGLALAKSEAKKSGIKVTRAKRKEVRESATREYGLYMYAEMLSPNPILDLFFDSYIRGYVLTFGLASRKVFVGRVIYMGKPTESSGMDQEITIIPFFSGYEDKDKLQVVIENDISKLDTITLRQEAIIYAHYYKPSFQNKAGINEELPNATEPPTLVE